MLKGQERMCKESDQKYGIVVNGFFTMAIFQPTWPWVANNILQKQNGSCTIITLYAIQLSSLLSYYPWHGKKKFCWHRQRKTENAVGKISMWNIPETWTIVLSQEDCTLKESKVESCKKIIQFYLNTISDIFGYLF